MEIVGAGLVGDRLERPAGIRSSDFIGTVNYEKAGFPNRPELSCTAPVHRRSDLAAEALQVPPVVRVGETPTWETVRPLAVTYGAGEIDAVPERLADPGRPSNGSTSSGTSTAARSTSSGRARSPHRVTLPGSISGYNPEIPPEFVLLSLQNYPSSNLFVEGY